MKKKNGRLQIANDRTRMVNKAGVPDFARDKLSLSGFCIYVQNGANGTERLKNSKASKRHQHPGLPPAVMTRGETLSQRETFVLVISLLVHRVRIRTAT